MRPDPAGDVRLSLDRLRRQTGVPAGDPFDLILRTVEALASAMAALSVNAASLIEDGQRQVGAVVSAAMTRQALWRLVLLPALIGGAVAILGGCAFVGIVMQEAGMQRSNDRAVLVDELARLHNERAAFRIEISQERARLAAEKGDIEANLPALLIARADTLTAAARNLVQAEAGSPGLIAWVAQGGRDAMAVWRSNGGTLCPRIIYEGATPMCTFPKP